MLSHETHAPPSSPVEEQVWIRSDFKWSLCNIPISRIEQSNQTVVIIGYSSDNKFYEVAVPASTLPRFQDEFEATTDLYQPVEGLAEKIVEDCFLRNAARAIRLGIGLEYCYRSIVPFHLRPRLEEIVLEYDLRNSDIRVIKELFYRLKVFYQAFLLDNNKSIKAKTETRKGKLHLISLVRKLLEHCGGRRDVMQHWNLINQDYSPHTNILILGALLNVPKSYSFSFDLQGMFNTLITSGFLVDENLQALNFQELSRQYMPAEYLQDVNLPIEMMYRLTGGEAIQIRSHIVQTCLDIPSLQKPENHVQILLAWSSTVSHVPSILNDWIASIDGSNFYGLVINDIARPQSPEQLGLSLAALISYRKLIPCTRPDKGHSLVEFNNILSAKSRASERAVFERMAFSLLRVLATMIENPTYRFLSTVLDNMEIPVLKSLDGFCDQYWLRRAKNGENHTDALNEIGILQMLRRLQIVGDCRTA